VKRARSFAAALGRLPLLLLPAGARAHFFAQPYALPVPFALYAFGAAAALLLSFVVVGARLGPAMDRPAAPAPIARETSGWTAGRIVAVSLLVLCIVAGFVGTRNALRNINMTLFWIVFVLGVPYAVALVGDFYAPSNPWRALAEAATRGPGRHAYPQRLGYLPALLLYMAFIGLELFGHLTPRSLSIALLAYTAINLAGAWLFGCEAWFRYGEFFAVIMRLMGKMSCRARDPAPRWRPPFVGLLEQPATHMSLVLFILFMLSSTAFDGLHQTESWAAIFWKGIYPVLAQVVAVAPERTYAASAQMYHLWEWLALLLSPLLYLAVFAGFVALMGLASGTRLPARTLVLRFAMTLLPIAFVYHVTHYYPLLLSQGSQLVTLVSDPFGLGWNLFGTADLAIKPIMVDVEVLWHSQVALIVFGHIVSVWLAHVEALRVFPTQRRAAASQAPMLVLMMLFTTLGLWILSLPLAVHGG
jgi:hypothetical protein